MIEMQVPSRTLVLVLGDHLSHASAALKRFNPAFDAVLMIESPGGHSGSFDQAVGAHQ